MSEISFAAVDFDEVLGRLTLYAQNLSTALVCVGLEEKVLPGGLSAADLAQNTLLKLLDPLDGTVKWSEQRGQPTTSGILAYLQRVLERDFFDLKKSSLYKTTVYPDSMGDDDSEGDGITLDHMAMVFDTPEGQTLKGERVAWILRQFDGEPELREIAKLQFDPSGYNAYSNQELAQLLDTTVGDIENRKKRIKRMLRKLAAHRNAAEAEHV
jgi:DNA-directed RNA polymerase specialized sigma24 family protein